MHLVRLREVGIATLAGVAIIAAGATAPRALATPVAAGSSAPRTISLGPGATLVIPAGAVPAHAHLRVTPVRSPRGSGVVGRAVHLSLRGARRLRLPARITYRYPATAVPASVSPADVFHVAVVSDGRWVRLPSRVDRRRHTVSASYSGVRGTVVGSSRATGFPGLTSVVGVVQEWGQFWGEILGHRAGRPSCTIDPPSWVQGADTIYYPERQLFACAQSDPNDHGVLEYRLANNRGYGMWLRIGPSQPDWVWVSGISSYDDVFRRAMPLAIAERHPGELYLPAGAEMHMGFRDRGWSTLTVGAGPANDMFVWQVALMTLQKLGLWASDATWLKTFATCAVDTGSFLRSGSPAPTKITEGFSRGLSCARAVMDAAMRSASLRARIALAGKAALFGTIRTALAVADAAHYASDGLEMAIGLGTTLTVTHMPVFQPRPTAGTTAPASSSAPAAPSAPVRPSPPPPAPVPAPAAPTWAETTGGVAHTWTDPASAGGVEGPSIGGGQTVRIACRLQGFRVADGNAWWYRIASAPWSGRYYVSADAFYNDGATSGSLHGTPFVDAAVHGC
jgi:hypothetical protein